MEDKMFDENLIRATLGKLAAGETPEKDVAAKVAEAIRVEKIKMALVYGDDEEKNSSNRHVEIFRALRLYGSHITAGILT